MATAEIIAIGTELLLGTTLDTNTHFLAKALRSIGIDLYRTTVIGDNEHRIAELVKESLSRADIIITTGGLGPTVDDPTRAAIANVFDVSLEFHPDLWNEICERYKHYGHIVSENNKRQAFVPANAKVIRNAVGTAPAFYVYENRKLIVSLPGVPKEMEYLYTNHVSPLISTLFPEHAFIIIKTLHLVGIGESHVDQLIGDLETLTNPTVGLSAHTGQLDIRITSKAGTQTEAMDKVEEIKQIVQAKLAEYIYGEDDETLESRVSDLLNANGSRFSISLFNHENEKVSGLSDHLNIRTMPDRVTEDEFLAVWKAQADASFSRNIAFAVLDKPDKMVLLIGDIKTSENPLLRTYLGPREDFSNWLTNNELGYIYSLLKV